MADQSNLIDIAHLIVELLPHLQVIELDGDNDEVIEMLHIFINGLSKLTFVLRCGCYQQGPSYEKHIFYWIILMLIVLVLRYMFSYTMMYWFRRWLKIWVNVTMYLSEHYSASSVFEDCAIDQDSLIFFDNLTKPKTVLWAFIELFSFDNWYDIEYLSTDKQQDGFSTDWQ